MGVKNHGEEFMRRRFEVSASRLLRNIFQTGLFENAYVDPEISQKTVGNEQFMNEGFEAQCKSVVLLKNKNNILPMKKHKKVYIPTRRIEESKDWFGNVIEAHAEMPVNLEIVSRYYDVVSDPNEADFSMVFIESPQCQPYSSEEGYLPVTLQYRPYKATLARKESIAQDERDEIVNRTTYNKTNTCSNEADLDIVLETRKLMKDKPVIVSMNCKNPTVMKEFERSVDVILLDFNVQTQAILELICGNKEPSALLPFQIPSDMSTVETQLEDVSFDMECHKDEENHSYDFAFGMNFSGVIEDERVKKYRK